MKFNLGCGKHLLKDYINVDWELPHPQFLLGYQFQRFDLCKRWPYEDNVAEEIIANSILEHLDDMIFCMNECWRVLKPDGLLKVAVPNWHSDAAWRDPTHKRAYSINTAKYFDKENRHQYQTYGIKPWTIEENVLKDARGEPSAIIYWRFRPFKE